jgi:putative transposase
MPQSFACLHCHIIFSTKNREPLILPDWAPRLHEYLGGILRSKGNLLVAAGGMSDHLHLLISLGRETAVSDCVRDVKSNSAHWIHQTFSNLLGFAWQAGYGAFAVSLSQRDIVKKYIANQKEHHRIHTFQEEFLEFLKRHELKYDERYVWD